MFWYYFAVVFGIATIVCVIVAIIVGIIIACDFGEMGKSGKKGY